MLKVLGLTVTVKNHFREMSTIGRRAAGCYLLSSLWIRNDSFSGMPYDLFQLRRTFRLQREGLNVVIRRDSYPSSSENYLPYLRPYSSLFQYNHHMRKQRRSAYTSLQSSHRSPLLSYCNEGILLQPSQLQLL
jgi:hypothetical protein